MCRAYVLVRRVYLLVNAVNSMMLNYIMGNFAWHLALLSYSGIDMRTLCTMCGSLFREMWFIYCSWTVRFILCKSAWDFSQRGCIDHVATILNSMLTWQPFMKTVCCELPYTFASSSSSSFVPQVPEPLPEGGPEAAQGAHLILQPLPWLPDPLRTASVEPGHVQDPCQCDDPGLTEGIREHSDESDWEVARHQATEDAHKDCRGMGQS